MKKQTRQQIDAARRAAFAASYVRPAPDPVEQIRGALRDEAKRIQGLIAAEVRREDPTVGTVVDGYRYGAAEGSYRRAAERLGYSYPAIIQALDM